MVEDTSKGMMKMMRKEKYQAVSTDNVTRTGCLNQLLYLYSKQAARIKVIHTSNINVPADMIGCLEFFQLFKPFQKWKISVYTFFLL